MKLPLSALALAALLPLSASADDRTIVTVNGTPITQSQVFDRLWKRYGPDTLDEMVDELLMRQAVDKAGIKVSDAEVEKRYDKVRAQFSDSKIFEAELANAGSSPDKLKQDLRDQLQREKLIAGAEHLSVSEAELKKAFEQHKSELGRPEAVHLRHILVDKKEDADKILAEVKGGADFTTLAKEKSVAPTGKLNGGDYGFVSKGMLPPEIEQVAFAMKPGELREIPSPKGTHIIQALERRPAQPAQFSKVKDDLRELLLQDKIKAALPQYLASLRKSADIKQSTP